MLRLGCQLNELRLRATRPLRLGVSGLLYREERVLLVEHSYRDGWCLPGGGVEPGESLEQALHRELREELTAEIGALSLHGVYTRIAHGISDHIVVFTSDDFSLPGRTSYEIDRYGMFARDALPAGTQPGVARRVAEHFDGGGRVRCGVW